LPSFFKSEKLFKCPKCDTTIESSLLTETQIDYHLKHCDENKLVCIFCLKLYNKTDDDQIDYQTHLQKHVTKLFLTKSSTTTTTYTSGKCDDDKHCKDENNADNAVSVNKSQIKEQKVINGQKLDTGTLTKKKPEPNVSEVLTFSNLELKPRKRL
jgi:hypothetical protein